ncbi:MAG: tRNA (guanosine(46)-N7)-methyltransferase TrmB [Bacteroidetes bacterium]|nr:MAG: tRNA (guanosine(46)-N7)-methyltransferase TrmB [Bacteroidota bacterium]
MGKKKLERFREMETFDRVFQPTFEEFFRKDHPLKGNWGKEVFGNDHPIILELGCGKGEYTLGLARRSPGENFIGVDIKGARIWKGARTAHLEQIRNVAFLRTRIDFIGSFFGRDEVREIWITFPDPQEKKRRHKKRLTAALFLNRYRAFLVDGGTIHLKTDNPLLYGDTLKLLRLNNLPVIRETGDLYSTEWAGEAKAIQTFYESQFLSEGARISYIQFRLPAGKEILEPGEGNEATGDENT